MQPRHCENTSNHCANFFMPPQRKRGRLMRFCSRLCRTQQWRADYFEKNCEHYDTMNGARFRARQKDRREAEWEAAGVWWGLA